MAKNKKKDIVGLKCKESGMINYYIYKPNQDPNNKEKKVLNKFCKKLGKHTEHEVVKLKLG